VLMVLLHQSYDDRADGLVVTLLIKIYKNDLNLTIFVFDYICTNF
jgi:hypothetical protein